MVWEIEDQHATLKCESFVGSFDLSQPYLGMALRNEKLGIDVRQLFAFLVPNTSVETYIRGADLVAKYPPRNSDLVSYNTYFRQSENLNGVDFILSAQTSLLDSNPLTQVTSSFGAAEILVNSASGSFESISADKDFQTDSPSPLFLVRPSTTKFVSWVLILHPSDFHRATARLAPDATIVFWVFPDSLEKGVIRRATFQVRLVKREHDEQLAAEFLASAESASPPLAT